MDIQEQYLLERIKVSNQMRVEEFKDRRAEIDTLVKDTRNIEIYAIVGLVI